jgi:sodium transport system ATP-binding protein
VQAVKSVSFRADDGCVTGLLGPNGAGKTTTLRMLSGLMRPDSGRIQVDGREVTLLGGQATSPLRHLVAAAATQLLAGVLLALSQRLMRRESIVFRGA